LSEIKGEPPLVKPPPLNLSTRSSWEEARLAGEQLATAWNLGQRPAERLAEVMERQHGLLVLFVDSPQGISGAACRLPDLNTVFSSRSETDGRRNFNLAHELFHVLTWEAMPPREFDDESAEMSPRDRRIEYLADNFAGALLMPTVVLRALCAQRGTTEIHDWLNATASSLSVTAKALKTRLDQAELLGADDLLRIDPARLTYNGRTPSEQTTPKLYSQRFVEMLHWALDEGQLSVRRAAGLLDCTIEDLADLFRDYGMECPFDL
jgi:Zn-dependent peptidase ImmA (M78 family)